MENRPGTVTSVSNGSQAGALTEFAQMLGHDLRAPIGNLITALGMLEQLGTALTAAQRDELMATVKASAKLADEMLSDLMDVSRLAGAKVALNCDPVDLEALAAQCLAPLRPIAAAKGLTLELEAPSRLPAISGDAKKLRRVFANLLGNALKYTQAGRVAVRLTVVDGRVRVEVADTGIGIPKEAQPHLFEKFFQVAGREAAGLGGTGLGLAFCRQAIAAHGGHISVLSPNAEAAGNEASAPGSSFEFSLAIAPG